MKTSIFSIVFFSILICASTGFSEENLLDILRGKKGTWTAARFSAEATKYSPTLKKSQAEISLAKAQLAEINTALWPQLTLTGRYTRLSEIENSSLFKINENPNAKLLVQGVDDPEAQALWIGLGEQNAALSKAGIHIPINQWTLDAELQIPLSDLFTTIGPTQSAAELKVEASRAQNNANHNFFQFQAKLAFYNLIRQRAVIVLEKEREKEARERLRIILAAEKVGSAKHSDVLRTKSYAFLVNANLEKARANEISALAQARALTGLEVNFDTGEDVLQSLDPVDIPQKKLIQIALQTRAEENAMHLGLKSLEYTSTATAGMQWPQVFLVGKATFANPNTRFIPMKEEFDTTWQASAIVQWSPNSLLSGRAKTDMIEAEMIKIEADRLAFKNQLRAEITTTLGEDRSNLLLIKAAKSGVEAAEEGYRLKQLEYTAGATTLSEVLSSERELAQARMHWIDANIQTRMTRAKLSWLTHGGVASPM